MKKHNGADMASAPFVFAFLKADVSLDPFPPRVPGIAYEGATLNVAGLRDVPRFGVLDPLQRGLGFPTGVRQDSNARSGRGLSESEHRCSFKKDDSRRAAEARSSSPGPRPCVTDDVSGARSAPKIPTASRFAASQDFFFSASLRENFLRAQNTEKPPAFAGGFGLGAIPELEVLYTTTVTVVK